MVGIVPPAQALRDLFYASGLGFLLSAGYVLMRMVSGSGKTACFFCDAAVLSLGMLLYRSAAVSRFYAGFPRWYTFAGCVLGYFSGCSVLMPALLSVSGPIRRCAAAMLHSAAEKTAAPVLHALKICFWGIRIRIRTRKNEKRKSKNKKRLQNSARVLYNSK